MRSYANVSILFRGILLTICFWGTAALFSQPKSFPSGEFNAGLSLLRDSETTGYGFQVGIGANALSWFGLEAQSDAWPAFSKTDRELYSITGGPRFSWRRKNITPFAHFLVGGGFVRSLGITDGSFALKSGGGCDIKLSPKFAWRLEVDDFYMVRPGTHFLNLSAGIVYRWF